MFLKFFRTSVQGVYFFIPIFTFVLWLPHFIKPSIPHNFDYFYSSLVLTKFISFIARHNIISSILSFFTLVFLGFYLSRINFRHSIITRRTELPAFFFIVIALCAPVYHFSSYLIGIIPCCIALDRMMSGYKSDKSSFAYFDAGILFAIAGMIEMRLLWLTVLIWIALLILRPFKWREWLYSIIGFLIPFVFYVAYNYLFNISNQVIIEKLKLQFELVETRNLSKGLLMSLAGIAFIFIITNWYILITYGRNKIQSRKYFYVLFCMFLLLIGIYFIPAVEQIIFLLLAVPLAFLFTYYFTLARLNTRNEILLLILILSAVIPRLI